MSALGLTAEQKKQVMTMTSLIASAQRYTIQELAEKAATDKTTAATLAKNMAKATEKRTTEQITAAMMTEILNSKKLTAAQKEAIVAALRQTAANEKQAFSLKVLGANAKAAFAAMAINPMTWITLAVTAVMGLVQVWQSVKQRAEEARQSMTEAAEAANDQRNSLADLIAEYKELATAGDFDSSARETAKRIQKDITDLVGAQADNLDLVNGKLDDEIKKLDNIKLQAAYDARDTLDTKYRDAMSRYNQGINAEGSGTNFLGVVTDAGGIDQILRKIGYVNDAWENVNGQISISYALAGKNAEEVLAMYKELQHVLLSDDSWQSMADSWLGDSSQDVLNNVQQQIEFYQGLVDDYNSAQENFLKNEAVIDLGETLKTTDINTQDAFDGYIQGIKDSTEYSEAYKKILLELANDTFPEFSGAMQQATNNGGTSVYIAQLEKLTDVISGLQSSYDALASAESDMAGGGGLSAETIESLAGAEEKYLDYLYEENGVVKLNTAAWKENANAKMQGEMDEIQKEIDSLQERNATLQESIKYYEEQRNLGNDGGLWSGMIGNATEEIKKNNEAIAENQGKLAIYSSLYGSITGDLDAYTSALQNFSNVATTIDTISDSFQTLADLQAEVANGFTMSLDKALEFAKVYPEIMNNAQVAADGQIIAGVASGTVAGSADVQGGSGGGTGGMIHAIIKEMYANSKQHAYEDAAGKLYLNRRNLELGAQLAQYGITAVRGNDGVWYVDRVGGQLLYDKYRKYTYHEGGIVGGGDIKSNEQLSLLKTKEWVLSEQMVDNLTTQMDRINMLSDAMSDLPDYAGKSTLSDVMKQVGGSKTVNNITNNSRPIEVQIGDTIIHGADQSTVDKHIKVTRDMVNQIGRLIGIGR